MGSRDKWDDFDGMLRDWNKIVQRMDYAMFKATIEELRGFPVAETYAVELFRLLPDPLKMRERLRREFPEFGRLATLTLRGNDAPEYCV
jgi:hypothetical protein